jgi:hypothetical protein
VEPKGLESRVEALETHVRELDGRIRASEHDAAAARVLAGAADRDVTQFHSELRDFRQAAVTSFNALREDMTDLRRHVDQRLDRVDRHLDQIDHNFIEVDNGFIGIRGRLDAAATGQQQIVDILQRLIDDQQREH